MTCKKWKIKMNFLILIYCKKKQDKTNVHEKIELFILNYKIKS